MFELGQKIATREAYGKTLVELGAEKDFVVLDADLAEATKTCYFAKAYPNRFFDCGIAEGNMVGIAAGLAAAGKTVVASSFAMFAAGRAFEQIRNSVAYPHLNVKICATHAGITVGEDGATHQCLEDLAIMRVIPGMTVINPSDAVEAAGAMKAALETDGPFYIRFGRYAVPVVHDEAAYTFKIGKGERYVVAEDVVTKGGRVQETIDLVKAAGGKVAGVVLLVDRSGGKVKFGRIPMFSLMQMTPETWTAAECPMCKAGSKPVHPGS